MLLTRVSLYGLLDRPGRLDQLVYVPLPDRLSRLAILNVHFANRKIEAPLLGSKAVDDGNYEIMGALADMTHGYSGAELAMLCREASMAALRERIQQQDSPSERKQEDAQELLFVKWRHIETALNDVKPRISSSKIQFYEDYEKKVANCNGVQ